MNIADTNDIKLCDIIAGPVKLRAVLFPVND